MNLHYLRKTAWSNSFFLIPLLLSIKYGILWYSIILGCMIILSSIYHYSNNFRFRYPDIFVSSLLIISNIYLMTLGNWDIPFSVLALITAVIALLVYYLQFKNHRVFYHNIWHILSAAICYFSILTFVN